jgi:hypothetical protein
VFIKEVKHPMNQDVAEAALLDPVSYFYRWTNHMFGSHTPVNAFSPLELLHRLNASFAPDARHHLNGLLVAKGIPDLYDRFIHLRRAYRSVEADVPWDEAVIDLKRRRVAVAYKVQFVTQDTKHSTTLEAQSIFTVGDDGRITQFDEVSTERRDHL